MTPRQEAAKIPLDAMCHDCEMKPRDRSESRHARCMSVRLQESTVFQFHNICECLSVHDTFSCYYVLPRKVLTEILHGEAVSLGIVVADAPAEVVAVMPMLLISIISILSVPSVVLENECTVACACEKVLLPSVSFEILLD